MVPPSDQDEHPVRHPRREHAPPAGAVRLTLAADWVAPSIARDRVERWLRALRWPPAQVEELVLALSEAVSNSVEHGYLVPPHVVDHPDVVEIAMRVRTAADGYRRAELVVRDHGSWREPDTTRTTRGHGTLIMRTCTDEIDIDGRPDGTTVVLLSRPVPPAPVAG